MVYDQCDLQKTCWRSPFYEDDTIGYLKTQFFEPLEDVHQIVVLGHVITNLWLFKARISGKPNPKVSEIKKIQIHDITKSSCSNLKGWFCP